MISMISMSNFPSYKSRIKYVHIYYILISQNISNFFKSILYKLQLFLYREPKTDINYLFLVSPIV